MAFRSITMMLGFVFLSGPVAVSAISFADDMASFLEQLSLQQKPQPPPNTVNNPKKAVFYDPFSIDPEKVYYYNPKAFVPGSKEDKEASQWYVVTRDGYEYKGLPEVLDSVFERALLNSTYIQNYVKDADRRTDKTLRYKRTIFDQDDREKVQDPSMMYPHKAIGRVNGCTGAFIGPRHILTAGHCIYHHKKQQWYDQLDFHQAKDCDPDKGNLYRWKYAIIVKEWKDNGNFEYDYGMIVVEEEANSVMEYGSHVDTPQLPVTAAGYPGDKTGRCMWKTSCTITEWSNQELGHQCDFAKGMSGGPVYIHRPGTNDKKLIICVLVTSGFQANYCTRLTETRVEALRQWIKDY